MDGWGLTTFHTRFPGLYHKWGHGWPETTDKTVPYGLYKLLNDAISMLEAGEEVVAARAHATGLALAYAGSETATTAAIKALIHRAFPERFDNA